MEQRTYQMIHTAFTEMLLPIVSGLFKVRQRFLKVEPEKLQDSNVVEGSSNISLVVILLLLALLGGFLKGFRVNGNDFLVEFKRSFNLVVL